MAAAAENVCFAFERKIRKVLDSGCHEVIVDAGKNKAELFDETPQYGILDSRKPLQHVGEIIPKKCAIRKINR